MKGLFITFETAAVALSFDIILGDSGLPGLNGLPGPVGLKG
jgi:hypothetical protein